MRPLCQSAMAHITGGLRAEGCTLAWEPQGARIGCIPATPLPGGYACTHCMVTCMTVGLPVWYHTHLAAFLNSHLWAYACLLFFFHLAPASTPPRSKFFWAEFSRGLRVIICTANAIKPDCNSKTQGTVWVWMPVKGLMSCQMGLGDKLTCGGVAGNMPQVCSGRTSHRRTTSHHRWVE